MDTKTARVGKTVTVGQLVVGQYVFMRSGRYVDWGKVVEITPTGVLVQHIFEEPTPEWEPKDCMIRFDENGIACESCDYKGGFWADSKIPGTEDGPWKLYLDPAEAGFARTRTARKEYLDTPSV